GGPGGIAGAGPAGTTAACVMRIFTPGIVSLVRLAHGVPAAVAPAGDASAAIAAASASSVRTIDTKIPPVKCVAEWLRKCCAKRGVVVEHEPLDDRQR